MHYRLAEKAKNLRASVRYWTVRTGKEKTTETT